MGTTVLERGGWCGDMAALALGGDAMAAPFKAGRTTMASSPGRHSSVDSKHLRLLGSVSANSVEVLSGESFWCLSGDKGCCGPPDLPSPMWEGPAEGIPLATELCQTGGWGDPRKMPPTIFYAVILGFCAPLSGCKFFLSFRALPVLCYFICL